MLMIGAHSVPTLTMKGSWLARTATATFSHAGYSVDIFFCMSGFLICTLLLREKAKTGTIALGKFYIRRSIRILPPLMAYLIFILMFSWLGLLPHFSVADILSVILFCRNYVAGAWYTGHFWSLAVEEHFYLFAPLFILVFSQKWAIRTAAALIVVCIVMRDWEFRMGTEFGYHIDLRTETRYDGLLWGCLLAFAMQSGRFSASARKYLSLPVILGVTALTVVLLTILPSLPERRTIVACFMPVVLAYTVLRPDELAGKLLETPILKGLGRMSYSLYLWQQLFLPKFEHPLPAIQSFPVSLIGPVICASISFYLIEVPMIDLRRRFAAAPRSGSFKRLG